VQEYLNGRGARLLRSEHGTATSEFLILLVCIALAVVATWRLMGEVVISIISGEGR
jgi:Flp pilus assembly pilin Flp